MVKIKEARGRAKGLVTKYLKKLQADLLIEDNEFLLDEIKSDEVQELFQKLDKSQNDFEDLHERYLEHLQDKSGLESEENYAAEVERNFSATKRSYMKYKKTLAVSIEKEMKLRLQKQGWRAKRKQLQELSSLQMNMKDLLQIR